MAIEQLVTFVAVAYASVTLGVLLKFKQNGLKGAMLWLAPFTPLLVFFVPIIVAIIMDTKAFKEKFGKRTRLQRLRTAWLCFIVTIRISPFLVGCVGEIIRYISLGIKQRNVADAIPSSVREMYQMAFGSFQHEVKLVGVKEGSFLWAFFLFWENETLSPSRDTHAVNDKARQPS